MGPSPAHAIREWKQFKQFCGWSRMLYNISKDIRYFWVTFYRSRNIPGSKFNRSIRPVPLRKRVTLLATFWLLRWYCLAVIYRVEKWTSGRDSAMTGDWISVHWIRNQVLRANDCHIVLIRRSQSAANWQADFQLRSWATLSTVSYWCCSIGWLNVPPLLHITLDYWLNWIFIARTCHS